MRSSALVLLSAALIAVPVPAHAASPSSAPSAGCSWSELAPPAGLAGPRPVAAAGHGVFLGTATSGSSEVGVLWQDGVARNLGRAFGYSPYLMDVNAHGTVVGQAGNTPVRYHEGRWERLPLPAGQRGIGSTINNAGDILGVLNIDQLIFWPAARPGTYELVTDPFPGYTTPDALTEDGALLISGIRWTDDGRRAAIRETDGTWKQLARAEGAYGNYVRGAAGDQILGEQDWDEAVLWDRRTGEQTHVWPAVDVADLNASGQALGVSLPTADQPATSVVWRDGVVEHVFPNDVDGWTVGGVGIDDDGTVLGGASGGETFNSYKVFLARC